MGGKNSKREEPCGSTPPRGSPSTKVYRSRSLPIKVFNRKLGNDYGGSVEGKPLHEDADDIDQIEEYRRLVELENLHGRDKTGLYGFSKQYITRSCINSLRSSREEIIYEEEKGEEDDSVARENQRQVKVDSLKASPICSRGRRRSRLSSQSAPCFAEYLGEAEGVAGAGVISKNVLIQLDSVVDASPLGENPKNFRVEAIEGTNATSQEDVLGSANCDAKQSEVLSATKSVDNSSSVESLSSTGVLKLNSELSCTETDSDACEGCSSLQANYSTIRKDDKGTCTLTYSFGTVLSLNGAYSDIILTEAYDCAIQVQYSVKSRTWKRLKRNNFSKDKESDKETSGRGSFGCEGEEGMTVKDKVNLPFNNSGKRQQDTLKAEFTDTVDMAWNSSSGKRIKDRVGGEEALSDIQPDAFAWGLVGESDPFLGFDAADFFGKVPTQGDQMSGAYIRRSLSKISKGTSLARRVRGLRASPKPVTSLESCLRAQIADPLDRNRAKSVIRPLKFSSSAEKGNPNDVSVIGCSAALPSSNANMVDESSSKSGLSSASTGLPNLTNLSIFLKEYAVKLAMTSKGESDGDVDTNPTVVPANYLVSSSPCDDNSSTATTFETLLFSFGVALGVLFGAGPHQMEVKRLNQLLDETQANLEALKLEPGTRESPARTNDSEAVGRSQYETQQQHQMAELEAELEAELDQLTGRESAAMESQYSVLDELDMDGVASVVYGDLEPTGLPAGVEEDSDDDLSALAQPACLNNYAVSPRELTRLLRKLQRARQEELITELEGELEATQSKLQNREKELEMWKDRVRRFTEVSFGSGSGSVDECATPDRSTMSFVPVDKSSIIIEATTDISVGVKGDEVSIHSSLQTNGYEVENHPVESGSHLEPVLRGEPKTGLHREPANQEPQDMRRNSQGNGLAVEDDDVSNEFLQSMIEFEDDRPFQGEVIYRDCRPILENSQIITQLIDSVHELDSHGACGESVELCSVTPSVGPFSSCVSMADTWEHPLESATFEGRLFPRSKLLVPYPSRRASYNSDFGQPVLIRSQDNGGFTSLAEHGSTTKRYSELSESLKSVSDMSGVETADYKPCEASFSVKYKNSTTRPASEPKVSAGANPSFWVGVGRAGLTTPVEKGTKLLKAPQNPSVQWPGELTPTVQEKIARWEGLMEGQTPGPAPGADWECQSRASETIDHQDATNFEYDDNVFSEDNLLLETEEILGRMLVQRIVEKSKHAAGSLVKKAQTALATLERDDRIEADVYYGGDTYMDERTDSEVCISERASELKEGWNDDQVEQQTSFLDDAVREEYEFFRRLEIINKDRKSKKVVKKEAATKEIVGFATASESDLESNSQLSPGSPRSGVLEEESSKEKYVKQVAEPSSRGSRDTWPSPGHARQFTLDRGIDDRRDEVRSRRRL
ncbi:uncharacterized protein [Physcomitrium patens]|uniref:uncharacterized protein isoform X3 n=1 Tax=Physcomitrium patens TaxID=3218 RepID=UPI003CCE3272